MFEKSKKYIVIFCSFFMYFRW